ncbi:uncharacterized protein FOMMEDRAFT_139660 [Fomitiporia mediterranea MF3/22]|uniref:uncharacterized protein n=1 Tax=Fomitiporia mediterranea (strain MF3/22) TaxID=694068 RepID=UPI00044082FD|nr:uncharacterized protein FOMMEDRAFT_139660 [Fomitiporia mediterranea MF3/22]EJD05085.1 hypothetical protein FOMMEDRAFT_139660 [Fomitiporia mediterranea MF3/22]
MRLTHLFLVALTVTSTPAAASWWSSDKPEYSSWDAKQLKTWLKEHDIEPPKGYNQKELQDLVASNWNSAGAWTYEQYKKAQKVLGSTKESVFDTWDESRLREFLLEQGVVAPSGPREQLVLAAKQHYRGYTNAASSFASTASRAASTAVYGDAAYQASKSVSSFSTDAPKTASSVAAQATSSLARSLDDSKDYVYSTWNDNQLRDYLVKKGVIKSKQQATRVELLAYMRDAYAKTSDSIWDAWSDSYIHEWLVSHGIIKSDFEKKRDALTAKMRNYYYVPQQHVWDTWSESELRQWLIEHNVIKSNAQVRKEKLQKLVAANYASASDTIWSSWSDSDLRSWLIDHGYIRSDAQVKRDDLVKLMNAKYNEANARTAAYLTWPDARLRAFLRNHGLSEDALPTSRPGLLQETRIRYVQTTSLLEQIYSRLRSLVASGVTSVEETLGQVLDVLSGAESKTKTTVKEKGAEAEKKAKEAKSAAEKKKSEL